MNEILPRLWLGSWQDAERIMKQYRWQDWVIICTAIDAPNLSRYTLNSDLAVQDRFGFSINDSGTDPMDSWFMRGAVRVIRSFINNPDKQLLVHCVSGVNRSPATVISFLMYYKEWDLEKAFRFVAEKRPVISPCVQQLKNAHFAAYWNGDANYKEIDKQEVRKIRNRVKKHMLKKYPQQPKTDVELFVEQAYENILNRKVDPDGYSTYVHAILTGRIKKEELYNILRNSAEYKRRFKK